MQCLARRSPIIQCSTFSKFCSRKKKKGKSPKTHRLLMVQPRQPFYLPASAHRSFCSIFTNPWMFSRYTNFLSTLPNTLHLTNFCFSFHPLLKILLLLEAFHAYLLTSPTCHISPYFSVL